MDNHYIIFLIALTLLLLLDCTCVKSKSESFTARGGGYMGGGPTAAMTKRVKAREAEAAKADAAEAAKADKADKAEAAKASFVANVQEIVKAMQGYKDIYSNESSINSIKNGTIALSYSEIDHSHSQEELENHQKVIERMEMVDKALNAYYQKTPGLDGGSSVFTYLINNVKCWKVSKLEFIKMVSDKIVQILDLIEMVRTQTEAKDYTEIIKKHFTTVKGSKLVKHRTPKYFRDSRSSNKPTRCLKPFQVYILKGENNSTMTINDIIEAQLGNANWDQDTFMEEINK